MEVEDFFESPDELVLGLESEPELLDSDEPELEVDSDLLGLDSDEPDPDAGAAEDFLLAESFL